MAVNREFNWLGQERIDIPYLRMIESAIRYDFDASAYAVVGNTSQIITGFDVAGGYDTTLNNSQYHGQAPQTIQINVGGAKIIHPLATESGSFFVVSTSRTYEVLNASNSKITGSFATNSTNFVGIDLLKSADSTTADVVQLLDMSTDTETPTKVPLARTLDYQFYISTTDFSYSPNIAPVCIVITNSQGVVSSVIDARQMLGRLTPGGSVNNVSVPPVTPYGWPGGRDEITGASNAGDKSLTSLKLWMNAVSTRLWELGGGQYWYSLTADRNVKMIQGAATFSSTGEAFEVISGNLHWQGLSFIFDNSSQYAQTVTDQITSVAGLTDLAVGQCVYVDINRTSTSPVVAQKGNLATLGGSSRPGQRYVIAANIGGNFYVRDQSWPVGHSFQVATTTVAGAIKTNLDIASATPVAATISTTGASTGYVTGSGLSHNLDVGIAHGASDTASDIVIGRLSGAGDQNIKLQCDGNYGTKIYGPTGSATPYLSVQGSGTANINSTPLSLDGGNAVYRSEGSWSLLGMAVLPVPPANGTIKYFCRPSKFWLNPVNAVLSAASPTWTIDGTHQILTCGSSGIQSADSVTFVLTYRILVNITGFAYNGIYTVTNTGAVGNATLTRSTDSSAQWQLFDGVTVPVSGGLVYSHINMSLNCPTNYNAANIDGSTVLTWGLTNSNTLDHFCIMFGDGNYVTLASSSTYYAGIGAY